MNLRSSLPRRVFPFLLLLVTTASAQLQTLENSRTRFLPDQVWLDNHHVPINAHDF